jgi:hypothetical protein
LDSAIARSLARVGDQHTADVGLENLSYRPCWLARLERHLIVGCEALGEELQILGRGLDPASRSPDSSLIATSQKSRCTSSAIDRM